MIWITHPTGNVFVRALIDAVEHSDTEYAFYTTLGLPNTSKWFRFVPAKIREELSRRSYDMHTPRMRVRPLREAARLAAGRCGLGMLTVHESGCLSVDSVYCDLDAHVASQLRTISPRVNLKWIYSYEDCAAEMFSAAKESGVSCCYELPIAYWKTSQRLLQEEAERLPEWEPTLLGTRDSAAKLERKTLEASLADAIICPSQFVYRSLPESLRKSKMCIVAEFGSPAIPHVASTSERSQGSRLRVLFVGSLSQRKGLADLFTAMKVMDRSDVELVVMGAPVVPMEFYRKKYGDFVYEPPRAHSGVIDLMKSCDLLVLPSIVEGRALVQQEAMSCGLPIIVTANAGGEDLVEEGGTGFLVPIRAPETLATKIEWCADHRSDLREMGQAARHKAESYTWKEYGRKILCTLQLPERHDTLFSGSAA